MATTALGIVSMVIGCINAFSQNAQHLESNVASFRIYFRVAEVDPTSERAKILQQLTTPPTSPAVPRGRGRSASMSRRALALAVTTQ